MHRPSQVSWHLSQAPNNSAIESRSNATPPSDHGNPATTNINTMAKTKVVVTRQLIDEAQRLLDARKDELDIVQWQSEKVRPKGNVYNMTANHNCSHVHAPGSSKTPKMQPAYS